MKRRGRECDESSWTEKFGHLERETHCNQTYQFYSKNVVIEW